MTVKVMSDKEREQFTKRLFIMGGKAAPGYIAAKNILRLANQIAFKINKITTNFLTNN